MASVPSIGAIAAIGYTTGQKQGDQVDSAARKYTATGGWGFAEFDDGPPTSRYSKPAFPATRRSKTATWSSPVTHLSSGSCPIDIWDLAWLVHGL
jgi:hypothetical protein